MKLTTSILAVAMMAGGAWAQNTDAIDNARSTAKSLQQKQANDTNAALNAAGVPSKPAAGQATPKPVMQKTPVKVAAQGPKAKAVKPVKIAATEAKPAMAASSSADASKQDKPEEKKWAMSGKRDPFFSPVVQQQGGSGCSTGKKCLEIGHINVRGVVKSETGFIAVVTNDLNKAYFLHENDPVFNGYVVRITGDSVVFQETVQDKLGKPFTREVTKKIFTPAV
jgi:Tfp pilus assembly protein PilP